MQRVGVNSLLLIHLLEGHCFATRSCFGIVPHCRVGTSLLYARLVKKRNKHFLLIPGSLFLGILGNIGIVDP